MSLSPERLAELLDGFSRVRLLVVGDLVLDEYVRGDVERVSPEAPVPVVQVLDESLALGGAGNVVRNVVALGGSVSFCSVVGDDRGGSKTADLLKNLGVDPGGLVVAEGRPTTRKTRVVARNQQIVRFDRETLEPPSPEVGSELLRNVERALGACDGVVVEDYGKGLLDGGVGTAVMERCTERGIPVVVDPKSSLEPWRGASVVKPNLKEAEWLTGVRVRSADDLALVAARLRESLGGADVVVTRGGEGMSIFESGAPGVDVHTAARDVFDVQGAGDTTIAALALALRAGATLLEAAVLSNAAAGVVVGKVGTATASPAEVREFLPAAIAAAGDAV